MSEFGESPSQTAYARMREAMVRYQLEARGIRDRRVLNAMLSVPREEFVRDDLKASAYDDCPLPIGHGQTISQPFTVAFMCEAACPAENETVLEVGTGSGYGAAVLSRLSRTVYTVERLPALAAQAQANLVRLGYDNVHVRTADGTLGLPADGPFDAIVVTAGAVALPLDYLEQLNEGGRIVIPLGHLPNSQRLYRARRRLDQLEIDDLGAFAFVPLIGKHGWRGHDR